MFRTTYLKKFLLSGGTYAATAITPGGSESEGSSSSSSSNCDPRTGRPLRRTELPLYRECPEGEKTSVGEEDPSSLEQGISTVRKELWVWHDKYKGYEEKVKDIVITGKEHSTVLIEQLRKDELPVPRAGAIAISGLAGLILGLRGGWFKRIFYGTTCGGLMAAVCYPKEVAGISQDALATTKKYVIITYNFIYGVKPEGLKLPSPSEFLGGPVESPDKGKGESKSSAPAVSDSKPEKPVRTVRKNCPEPSSPAGETQEPQSISPQEPPCTCHLSPGPPPCAVHGQAHNAEQNSEEKTQQVAFHAPSNDSHFDRFAEQGADVVYWGFRLV